MTRIIFDIETTGVPWESLDQAQQDEMLKFVHPEQSRGAEVYPEQSRRDDEEIERAKKGLTFSPLTGEVVAIGLLNPDTNRGVVYFRNAGSPASHIDEGSRASAERVSHSEVGHRVAPAAEARPQAIGIDLQSVAGEPELLERFWSDIKNYNQLISFNGRTFDGPFVHIRSAILGIPTTKQLVPYRYGNEHIDLLDQLTFLGAARRGHFTLDMVCKAFGIQSPKSGGVTGDDVPRLFAAGKAEDIARYCAGDLVATRQLFEKWEQHFRAVR